MVLNIVRLQYLIQNGKLLIGVDCGKFYTHTHILISRATTKKIMLSDILKTV